MSTAEGTGRNRSTSSKSKGSRLSPAAFMRGTVVEFGPLRAIAATRSIHVLARSHARHELFTLMPPSD